jgi:excisionase family DNA binding protein
VNSTKGLLNVSEFAAALGVTTACIRRWILERRVANVKLGRLVRIPETELERLIKSGFRPAVGRTHEPSDPTKTSRKTVS